MEGYFVGPFREALLAGGHACLVLLAFELPCLVPRFKALTHHHTYNQQPVRRLAQQRSEEFAPSLWLTLPLAVGYPPPRYGPPPANVLSTGMRRMTTRPLAT